jgi:hypothetical protein
MGPGKGIPSRAEKHFGALNWDVSASSYRKWWKNREKLLGDSGSKKRISGGGRKPYLDDSEEKLLVVVIQERAKKDRVTRKWIALTAQHMFQPPTRTSRPRKIGLPSSFDATDSHSSAVSRARARGCRARRPCAVLAGLRGRPCRGGVPRLRWPYHGGLAAQRGTPAVIGSCLPPRTEDIPPDARV